MRLWIYTLICSLSFIYAAHVYAQSPDCWPHCEAPKFPPMVETDPPMTKAAFYEHCEQNTKFNMLFECGCWSEKYDEMRVTLGRDGGHTAIIEKIIDMCRDKDYAGELEYKACLNSPPFGFKPTVGYSLENFCRCYGDKYTELFKAAPPPYPQEALNNLMLEARYACKRD